MKQYNPDTLADAVIIEVAHLFITEGKYKFPMKMIRENLQISRGLMNHYTHNEQFISKLRAAGIEIKKINNRLMIIFNIKEFNKYVLLNRGV